MTERRKVRGNVSISVVSHVAQTMTFTVFLMLATLMTLLINVLE